MSEELFRVVWITEAGTVQEGSLIEWKLALAEYQFLKQYRKVWIVDSENNKIEVNDDQA